MKIKSIYHGAFLNHIRHNSTVLSDPATFSTRVDQFRYTIMAVSQALFVVTCLCGVSVSVSALLQAAKVATSAILPYHHMHPGCIDPTVFDAPDHRKHTLRLSRVAQQSLVLNRLLAVPASRQIVPTDFGADPTGATDASPALSKAVAAFLALGITVYS